MTIADTFGKRRRNGPPTDVPEVKIPGFLETNGARAASEPDTRLTREVEKEIGEFIRANKMGESPEGPIDLESPPERAVEIANLITSGFEVYAADMRKVRTDVIAHAARAVYEIDSMIAELTLARDRIAAEHQVFMHSVRNRVVAIIEARKTIAAKVPVQQKETADETNIPRLDETP